MLQPYIVNYVYTQDNSGTVFPEGYSPVDAEIVEDAIDNTKYRRIKLLEIQDKLIKLYELGISANK